jgi:hypothetical protein
MRILTAAVCLRVSSLFRPSRRTRFKRVTPHASLAVLALSLSAAVVPVLAQDVQPGLDLFTTPTPPVSATTSGTSADFSTTPLPNNFFCPGSNQFTGTIYFRGSPFNFIDFRWYTTDTVIRRLDTATLPGNGSQDTIPIEIVAPGQHPADHGELPPSGQPVEHLRLPVVPEAAEPGNDDDPPGRRGGGDVHVEPAGLPEIHVHERQ